MVMIETQDLPRQMMQRANEEIERLRQQIDLIKADLMIANEAAKESWDQAKALEQQLAKCERERDSNYDEMQRAWAELKESIRERNAFQDQCISLKMKMTVMREERDELVAALIECRSSVKFDLNRYERMCLDYSRLGPEGEAKHAIAESEANRLDKLIDTIDAIAKVGADKTGEKE